MVEIDSLDKAFAYALGRLDLDTGEIGGNKVDKQLNIMYEYCKHYGEFGDRREDVCPNYINCRYHPIPSWCTANFNEDLISILKRRD